MISGYSYNEWKKGDKKKKTEENKCVIQIVITFVVPYYP